MKADAAPVLAIFEKKLRLEIPIFQRQYVWSRDHQWEPLWEDIQRKFAEYITGRKDAPVHFLGAMVLDQKQTPTTHVEKRQIIDGQQRLTTLQIFLAAFRDFCMEQAAVDLAKECDSFILNKGMMADPDVDKFKIWPTQADRAVFKSVILAGSRKKLEEQHPLKKRKYARAPDPRPRMVEAYLLFHDRMNEFFIGNGSEPPLSAEAPIAARLDECFQALKNSLMIVLIDLDQDDDAQVIFETLNARGEPLLPADLLRNFIFLRAARNQESPEALYEKYWKDFDEPFWREKVTQGRLFRPRSDLFMQHFLSSRLLMDIAVKHLFVEYKFWTERQKPFATVEAELQALHRQGKHFHRLLAPKSDDPIFRLACFLQQFDIGTAYPLLLVLMDAPLTAEMLESFFDLIQSYLLRRAVCGLPTNNYNRVFIGAIKYLNAHTVDVKSLREYFSELSGDSAVWPSEEAFSTAWETRHAYQTLKNARLVYILKRLNNSYMGPKHEEMTIHSPLSVEHILPQGWVSNWPLPDGSKGLTTAELWEAPPGDARAEATRLRNGLLQTIGNLTIVTQPLNSSLSNSNWQTKKEAMGSSLLPLNHQLQGAATWDEGAIQQRSHALFERARAIWQGPAGSTASASLLSAAQ